MVGRWGREVGVGVLLGRGTSVDGAGGRVSWGVGGGGDWGETYVVGEERGERREHAELIGGV